MKCKTKLFIQITDNSVQAEQVSTTIVCGKQKIKTRKASPLPNTIVLVRQRLHHSSSVCYSNIDSGSFSMNCRRSFERLRSYQYDWQASIVQYHVDSQDLSHYSWIAWSVPYLANDNLKFCTKAWLESNMGRERITLNLFLFLFGKISLYCRLLPKDSMWQPQERLWEGDQASNTSMKRCPEESCWISVRLQ